MASNGSKVSGTALLEAHMRYMQNEVPLKVYCTDENKLGEGGYGEVYRGKFDNCRLIAIKKIDKKSKKAEVEMHFSLVHENILNCLGTETDDKFKYYAFDLCAGTMADLFKEENRENTKALRKRVLSLPDLQVLHQMASGLAHLHAEGIVHGDIKPENILISLNDPVQMKLADFGISKDVTFPGIPSSIEPGMNAMKQNNAAGFFTLTTIRGTPAWFSPELIKLTEEIGLDNEELKAAKAAGKSIRSSTASDVFAYGLVSFYYVTRGIHPFGPEDLPFYACVNDNDVLTKIVPNIYHNQQVNLKAIDSLVDDNTKKLLLETIEENEQTRISAAQVVSRLIKLREESICENPNDISLSDRLINNQEEWSFAQVWEISKPSDSYDKFSNFSGRVINKNPVTLMTPPLMDQIILTPLEDESIDYSRLINRAIDGYVSKTMTVPTVPLILFGCDESTPEIPKVIGLLVPICNLNEIENESIKRRLDEKTVESLLYCIFCTSYSISNLANVIRIFGIRQQLHPFECAFQFYRADNLIEILEPFTATVTSDYPWLLSDDEEGWNALLYACLHYNGKSLKEIVSFLISNGINVKAKIKSLEANALHIVSQYYKGVDLKEIMELLIEKGINPLDKTTEGWNILHQVCRHYTGTNLKVLVHYLINLGIDVNDKINCKRPNALHFLCQHYTGADMKEIIEIFIENGIQLTDTDDEGWNGLHFVCAFYRGDGNLKDIIDLFIKKGVDPRARDYREWQVLHILCRSYNRENLEEILISSLIINDVNVNSLTIELHNALFLLCRHYTRRNLNKIVNMFYDVGFQMDRVEFEWGALINVCFVNRGPQKEILEIVRIITQEILKRDRTDAKIYLGKSLEMLRDFNLDLDRKEVVGYLEQLINEQHD